MASVWEELDAKCRELMAGWGWEIAGSVGRGFTARKPDGKARVVVSAPTIHGLLHLVAGEEDAARVPAGERLSVPCPYEPRRGRS